MTYIGSKINVTTTTGNQYDGILTAINTQEATIELQMVRLVVAGGRPVKDGDTYDFILFKSDDIKDLYVYEEPAPTVSAAPKASALSDPAVVAAKPMASKTSRPHNPLSSRTENMQYDWLEPDTPSMAKRVPQYGGSTPSTQIPQNSAEQHHGPVQEQRPTTKKDQAKVESYAQCLVINSETITTPPSTFAAAAAVAPTFTPGMRQQSAQQPQPQSFQKTQRIRSYSTVTKQTTEVSVPVQQQQQQQQNRNPQYQQQQRGKLDLMIQKSEFDFARSNQKFDKEQIAAEVAPVLTGDGPYYSRSSSFFDNISSETTSSNVGEDRTRNERSWNMETFGAPFVRGGPSGQFRHGGRGGRMPHRNPSGPLHSNK
jgi:hypothetical protein